MMLSNIYSSTYPTQVYWWWQDAMSPLLQMWIVDVHDNVSCFYVVPTLNSVSDFIPYKAFIIWYFMIIILSMFRMAKAGLGLGGSHGGVSLKTNHNVYNIHKTLVCTRGVILLIKNRC